MRKKQVAATLALFLGIFGVHRFYLGKRFLGVLHFGLFMFSFMILMEEDVPLIIFPAILGFIDAVLLFVMPKEEFDEKYNKKWIKSNYADDRNFRSYGAPALPAPSPARNVEKERYFKKKGVQLFRQFRYEGAIEAFDEALEINFEDPSTHFNLSCCYSLLNETDNAYYHLEKAVEFGFKDVNKIYTHRALSNLRADPGFHYFIEGGFKAHPDEAPAAPRSRTISVSTPIKEVPPNQKEVEEMDLNGDLLTQIVRLGELRDKGILTEEEFKMQKEKILAEK